MFFDVSPLIAHNAPGRYSGIAAADVDGDGRPEFVVAGFDGPNRVLRWTGTQLRDVAPPAIADADRPAVGLAAGDLDGDGREELYILNADARTGRAADRLLKPHPDGRWEDLFDRPGNRAARNLAAGRSVAAVDRRGVGRYGFAVATVGRPLRLYELVPDGRLADLAPSVGLDRSAHGCGLLAAPLFGPPTDLICTTKLGPNLMFRNRGDGTFEECAAWQRLDDPDEHGRGVTAVDAAGDGRPAVCWGNEDGPHRLMARAADGTWKDRATPGLAFPSTVRTVIAADFDNDGHDELFFNNTGEPNRLFRVLASDGRQPPGGPGFDIHMLDPCAALEPDGHGTGAAVADVDGDGVLELLVAHGGPAAQRLTLYKSRTAGGNGWLRVVPLTRFGGPARGAAVRAEVAGRVRVKVVCGGSGYLCQMEPAAHFGLGTGRQVGRVTVTWPDGAAVTIDRPGVNRTLTVPYPRG